MKRGLLLDPSQHMPHAARQLGVWTQTVLLADEAEPEYADLGSGVDLILGSPAIYAEDEDASGDAEFVEAVRCLEPTMFVLETVRGLAAPRFEGFLHELVDDLSLEGRYQVGHGLVTLGGKTRLLLVGINSLKHPIIRNQGDLSDGADTLYGIIRDNLRRL